MSQVTDIDHTLDSAISRLCVFFFCVFFSVFHDLLFGCLHKQSISIKNSFLQEWLLYTQLLEMDIFHPFLGNDQVQACLTSFMILFYSKSYTSETNGSTKMEDIIYGMKTYNDKVKVWIMSFMILFHSKNLYNK